jgi:hypothetical protein
LWQGVPKSPSGLGIFQIALVLSFLTKAINCSEATKKDLPKTGPKDFLGKLLGLDLLSGLAGWLG